LGIVTQVICDPMGFQLAPEQLDDAAPVYLQIAGAVRAQVESGALASGDRLPTIRHLAETST
jgi:DNA-binding transcriptional regulator YhcF (GntR family)